MAAAPRSPTGRPLQVVVPTWNAGPLLARCVASVRAQAPDVPVHVVVSNPAAGPLPAGVRIDRPGHPMHFAEAANRGLAAAAGCDVLLLNDDAALQTGALEALRAARRRGGPGIYQPRIDLDDGSGRLDNLGHNLFFDGFNVARGRGRPAAAPPAGAEVGAFSGAAALLTAEVLAAVGHFDEGFEAFGEDLDLSLRARRCGFAIRAVPEARVHHRLGASYGRVTAEKVHRVERNRVRAAVRSLPRSALAGLPLWTTYRLLLTATAAASGRGMGAGVGPLAALAALTGAAAGLTHAPDAWRKRRADRAGWTLGEAAMWGHLWRHRARPADLWGRL